MEFKLDVNETIDDSVSLTDLENTFNGVVKELIGDKTLEKFYKEYQKLHESLINSHEHNVLLAAKCSELNRDIVKNSKQIANIVQMTQSDQKTIESLRAEFEKAWNVVEASSEKEMKSIAVINNLRMDIDQLSELVASNESKHEEDVYSFQEVDDQVKSLKNEIENNEKMIEDILSKLEVLREEEAKISRDKINLEPQIEVYENEIADSVKECADLKEDCKTIKIKTGEVEELIEKANLEKEEIKKRIKIKNEDIKEANRQLDQAKDSMLIFLEDQNLNYRAIEGKRVLLADAEKSRKKTEEIHSKMSNELNIKMESDSTDYEGIINKLDNEFSELSYELEELKRFRAELVDAKSDYIQSLKENTSIALKAQIAYNSETLGIRKCRIDSDNAGKSICDLKNLIALEKNEEQKEDLQLHSVVKDISVNKRDIKDDQEVALSIEESIKDKENETNNLLNEVSAQEEIAYRNRVKTDSLNIQLNSIQQKMKYLEIQKNMVTNERDSVNQCLQSLKKHLDDLVKKNEAIEAQSKFLKDEIRNIDDTAIRNHLIKLEILDQMDILIEESKKVKENTDIAIENAEKAKKLVSTKRHVLAEAEVSVSDLKSGNDSLFHLTRTIKNKISQALSEKQLQQANIIVLNNQLSQGQSSFTKIKKELKNYDAKMKQECNRQRELMYGIEKLKHLKNERRYLEMNLLRAKSLCVTLEEELQHPMSINKMFFLESTNPELYELYKMKFKILDKISRKMAISTRLNEKKAVLLDKVEYINKRLSNVHTTFVDREYSFLQRELKAKTAELNKMKKIFDAESVNVYRRENEVVTARNELRSEIDVYHDIRRKSISARNIVNESKPQKNVMRECVMFTGGGFSYSFQSGAPLSKPVKQEPKKRTTKKQVTKKKGKQEKKKKNTSEVDTLRRRKVVEEPPPCFVVKQPTAPPSARKSSRRNRRIRTSAMSENY